MPTKPSKYNQNNEDETNILSACNPFIALQATAQPLPRVTPEQVGTDTQRLKYADLAIQKAVDNKEIPAP